MNEAVGGEQLLWRSDLDFNIYFTNLIHPVYFLLLEEMTIVQTNWRKNTEYLYLFNMTYIKFEE